MEAVPILMVSELRGLLPEELKLHKGKVYKAKLQAPTELDREAYTNQLECINKILNEAETADQEKGFLELERDIEETTELALAVEATI